ncbi:MAG: hypothetical protein ACOCVC_07705, partial [Spirochaeta sp.]
MDQFAMRCMRLLSACCLLGVLALPLAGISQTATLQTGFSILLDIDDPSSSPVTLATSVEIGLFGESEAAAAEAAVRFTDLNSMVELQRLRTDWYPADALRISAGRFSEDWSPSIAFPAAVLFTPHALPGNIQLDGFAASVPWRLEAT